MGGCQSPTNNEMTTEKASEGSQETTPERQPEDASVEELPETPLPDRLASLQPKLIATIQPEVRCLPLPANLTNKTRLSFAGIPGGEPLISSENGLYRLKDTTFESVDDKLAFVGVATWGQTRFALATSDQIFLLEGDDLQPTLLHQRLDGSPITAIARYKAEALWIGTRDALWRLEQDRLVRYEEIRGISAMHWYPSLRMLWARETSGRLAILRQDDTGAWQSRHFDQEGLTLSDLAPANRFEFWGLDTAGLWLRRQGEAGAAWWPYHLAPTEEGKETLSFQGLHYDLTSGYAWVLTADEMYRLEGSDASKMPRPTELSGEITLAHGIEQGGFWMGSRTHLCRIGEATASITYTEHIAPFMERNCVRCHFQPNGLSFPLQTFEQVKDRVNELVTVLTPGAIKRMPPDRPAVGGDAELIKRWLQDGLKP
jgi:hypothetical protein